MQIQFAPLHGYTDSIYRNSFNQYFGGVDQFYTPFIRLENDGTVRRRDIREMEQKNNEVENLIPQIMPKNQEEATILLNIIKNEGYNKVDLNMGCPFPMVVKSGRGAGLLPYPERIESILETLFAQKEISISVKTRIGLTQNSEFEALIPILAKFPITHLTIHPRLGIQQYTGEANIEAFAKYAAQLLMPIVYNGDVTTKERFEEIATEYNNIAGIMIGRGLLQNPFLAAEIKGRLFEDKSQTILSFHKSLVEAYRERLSGDTHLLIKMKTLWDYLLPEMIKKDKKKITKSSKIENYIVAAESGIINYYRAIE